jgi:hypothetical protein
VIPQRDPLDDVVPQAAETHVGRDRDGCDDLQRRNPEPADEKWEAEGDLDLPEDLGRGHPHGTAGVDHAAIDGFESGVRTREDRRDGEQDERRHRRLRLEPYAQQQDQQHDEAEGRERPSGTGQEDGEFSSAAGVADEPSDGNGDHGGDQHRAEGEGEVLGDRGRQRQRARETVGREDPGERLQEVVHTLTARRARSTRVGRRRFHGMRTRPARTSSRSMTTAMTTTATTPERTSAMMRRCEPFVKR